MDFKPLPIKPRKVTRCTQKQIRCLINYMAVNRVFANGQFTTPLRAKKLNEEWDRLRVTLNDLGPEKSVEQWKQTWRDIKRKARRDNAVANANMPKASDNDVPMVSDDLMKVLNTVGPETSVRIRPTEELEEPDSNRPLRPSRQIRRRRHNILGEVPSGAQFLAAQEIQNNHLNRISELLERQNVILEERNLILKEKNIILRRNRRLVLMDRTHLLNSYLLASKEKVHSTGQ